MLEWLALPLAVGVAAFLPKGKIKDETIIKQIFENKGVCIKRNDVLQYPNLKSKIQCEGYTTYLFSMPYGLNTEDIEDVLSAIKEALQKEVEIEVDGYLKMEVFHEQLPKKWDYDADLFRPGTWEVPIGKNPKGILYHDFDKYAHFLVGGVPGFGKTVFMKSIFHTLLLNNPADVEFYILDLKGGLEFYKYSSLPQVKAVSCNVYETAEVLGAIVEKMKKMELHFRKNGYTNINDTPIKKRTFVIVDEGAELSPDLKVGEEKKYAQFCQAALSEICRIGRAVGYRCIYGTQYPSSKSVNMSIKMNIVSRISFIAASQVSSRVILDDIGAEDLPSIPGRAIYKVEKCRTVQVPYIDDNMMFKMMEERKDDLIDSRKSRNHSTDNRPTRNRKN
ncbi:FtsK/SpoIIIE domain-containing protein [Neobacillus sp. WH10]|uniref:FtsK/SpoIIIE domain-containing protein n=1 Tax=Neobacillus sp. WH10 TaxID=3047873 RepID=UPI0024C0F22E|nr:FtsK/SpoIIIE domain-containing protein [Neobacillus sp. WH10]WHY76211.1 FtsK/SpoIIIE domain-containing protein [Neobacillus sp. WH10]